MLQLGFDKAVKLTSYEDAALREVLALTASDYGRLAESLDTPERDRDVYWRIQFAILTVHSPLDASLEAYRRVRLYKARYGRLPPDKLSSLVYYSPHVQTMAWCNTAVKRHEHGALRA